MCSRASACTCLHNSVPWHAQSRGGGHLTDMAMHRGEETSKGDACLQHVHYTSHRVHDSEHSLAYNHKGHNTSSQDFQGCQRKNLLFLNPQL